MLGVDLVTSSNLGSLISLSAFPDVLTTGSTVAQPPSIATERSIDATANVRPFFFCGRLIALTFPGEQSDNCLEQFDERANPRKHKILFGVGGLDQSDTGDDRGDECSELRHFACLQKFYRGSSHSYYD
jgi:hypothetical protein